MYTVEIKFPTKTIHVGERATLEEAIELMYQAIREYIAPLKRGESIGSPLTDDWYIYHDYMGNKSCPM